MLCSHKQIVLTIKIIFKNNLQIMYNTHILIKLNKTNYDTSL